MRVLFAIVAFSRSELIALCCTALGVPGAPPQARIVFGRYAAEVFPRIGNIDLAYMTSCCVTALDVSCTFCYSGYDGACSASVC